MSRFLDQLGALASGRPAADAARPVLLSPMAQGESQGFEVAAEGPEQPDGAHSAQSPEPAMVRKAPTEPVRSADLAPTYQTPGPVRPDQTATPAAAMLSARPGHAFAQPVVGPNPQSPVLPAIALPQNPTVATLLQPQHPLLSADSSRPLTVSPLPRPLAPLFAAPLSPAAIAGRLQPAAVQAAAATPTIVHVTIDRIDVREAPAAKPSAQDRRPRPQPTVSLSDYLTPARAEGAAR